MKLFKSVDEKLSEIGFVKTREDQYGASYERINDKYNYTHSLDLIYKASGKHLIQSFQKDSKGEFSNMVGLSMYEAKLSLKKMKQMGWKVTR